MTAGRRTGVPTRLRIALCGPESAADVHRITQLAFAGYGQLHPPSGAMKETEESVRADLAQHPGAVARINGRVVGALRMERRGDILHTRRVAVDPAFQAHGIGQAMMARVERYARGQGVRHLEVGVRSELPGNRAFYERLGYRVVHGHTHPGYEGITWYEMRRPVTPD